MVALHAYAASHDDTGAALEQLAQQLAGHQDVSAGMAFLFYGCRHSDEAILDFLAERLPGVPLIGGTSRGLLCSGRLLDERSLGLLVIEDTAGAYGVAAAPLGDDPYETARQVLVRALENAGCPGELPDLVWVYQSPGQEEQVVAGLHSLLGDSCPIIGGSAADDTISGQWRMASAEGALSSGLAIAVLFPSGGVACAYQGGYRPTGTGGTVTRLGGEGSSRRILEIDGQPAAEVYNGWLGGRLDSRLATGGSILVETTMDPLAIQSGEINGIPQYLLVHPESIDGGALQTFVAVDLGERLELMTGSQALLIERAGKVALDARSRLPGGGASLAGGLMVYCAGCRIAVGDGMEDVARTIAQSFGDRPHVGCFTFGELGQIVGRNRHGNLMISAVMFGR